MKHSQLRSIAHNMADSLASGIGLLIGVYETDIFGESRCGPDDYIEVDFLKGTSSGCIPSGSLAQAIRLYRDALPGLCQKHGVDVSVFSVFTARFSIDRKGRSVLVVVEDQKGRRSVDQYTGTPLRRVRIRDWLGRLRPKPGSLS